MRIASLVPAGTEMVCALGMGSSLVAVTHDCDYPPDVQGLPRLTRSSIPAGASARDIDRAVRDAVSAGESTFHLDADALAAARPDVVVGQTLCVVCAVTLDALPALRARVVPLDASSLDGVFDDIARVADAIAVAERGRRLVESLRARLDRIRAAARGDPRPRVACLEWLDPLFNGGHWVPEQVSLAGGEDVLGVAGARSREVDFAELERADPDTIVLMPCGFHIDRARADRDELVRRPEWRGLRAARAGRVHAVDGAAYFSRPGPRLVDGVEVLASLLHPSATYTSRAN